MPAKIRTGFVSNSSSSSFIIMGDVISFEDAKNYTDAFWILDEWSEGNDCINLTPEVLEFLNENPKIVENIKSNSKKLFGNRKTLYFDGYVSEYSFTEKDLHKDIYSFDKSYHCCDDDIGAIKSRYGCDEDDD